MPVSCGGKGVGVSLGDQFLFVRARRLSAPILTAIGAWRTIASTAEVEIQPMR
jgi:hypothetical protein